MGLAIFDLDNTLIGGDSDYLWNLFLAELDIIDGTNRIAKNEVFYQQYLDGTLNIYEFLTFQFEPLKNHPFNQLITWRAQYIKEKIQPIILPKALELISFHQRQGHTLLIITATNRFITQPIAEILGVQHLIATEPEMQDGCYTGRVEGTPSYREGKITRLHEWLALQHLSLDNPSWFYSDSHNDIPLLEQVTYPTVVDPDKKLATHAKNQGWKIISLRT
ncbi:histidinol-phosphatase [Candidatus Nitrosacidococcus tergens]|uniref:Histidinol-phosphatase n=1 Tax=Candidatus Nitrosacidococcus tergens TaxID=553981 RepID=A0A7G1QAN8_9GAMM|nr:HAD family hydrolase [Candidatus Nitrosacidococcus tergens]CAB1276819.1 HAD-superfamily subfamily IB, PSPase-like protein [Candidatus Nitrosacidococcus tergens]